MHQLVALPAYPRPSWWNDEELLRLSEEVLTVGDKEARAHSMVEMQAEALRASIAARKRG